jgi:hypothetical protein
MHLKNNIFFILFLIAITLVSSYCKETLFSIINYLLQGKVENYANTLPPDFLLKSDTQTLVMYKWIVLGLNILIINSVNVIFLYVVKQKKLLIVYIVFILSIIFMGVLFLLLSKISSPIFVEFSRTFQSIVESPLLLFILLLIYYFPSMFIEKQPNE